MGPLEGDVAECAEAIVHELCHAVLLKINLVYGRCRGLEDLLESTLESLHEQEQNKNEIQALAAESLVLERLGVEVSWNTLVYMGERNLKSTLDYSGETQLFVDPLLNSARKDLEVIQAAEAVQDFIAQKWGI